MALTAIALCSQALIRLGCTTISGFNDGSAEATVATNLYPALADSLLSSHPWSFATTQASLARLVEAPAADFAHAYQVPADFLRALSAGVAERGAGLVYRLRGDRLETDADSVLLTYVYRPDPRSFPPYFDAALIARLAADFCLPLTESTSRAQFLYQLAEQEFRRAKLADAQQSTPQALADFPLIDVRG